MRALFHSIMARGQLEYVLTPKVCFSLKKSTLCPLRIWYSGFMLGMYKMQKLISETLSVSQGLISFFSSCQNQELELLYARVKRTWSWKYVKLEWSLLVANPGEGFIAKVRIGRQITLQQAWENTGTGEFSSHDLLSNV